LSGRASQILLRDAREVGRSRDGSRLDRQVGKVSGCCHPPAGPFAPLCGCAPRCRSISADTLDFVDSNSIELCDLLPRHPVARQGADTTVLGSKDLAGLWPDCRLALCRLSAGRGFDLRRTHRLSWRDHEDTWLAPRLVVSRRRGIRGGSWHVSTGGWLPWLEQIFSGLASAVDPFTTRPLPFLYQELPQRKSLTGK
jgi:hypothetical protein